MMYILKMVIDLTSCLYEYQGIQSRLLNWGEDYRDFNEEYLSNQ